MPKSSLQRYMPYFKMVSLFNGLSEIQIRTLIQTMSTTNAKESEIIAKEGAHEDTLFILLQGEVEISKRLLLPLWGESVIRQEKSLIRLSENDHAFFGEMALFDDKPERSASITALKPCTLAVLEKKVLLKILETNSEIGVKVFKNIAKELTKRLVKANKDILKLTTAFSLALEGD